MSYFRELPNLKYPSFLKDKNSSLEYVDVKNFFRRVKLREDLQNIMTVFDKYEIPIGHRPDNVAEDLYGSAELDWVVITCSGIINIRDEWPLDSSEIYTYAENKYGLNLNDLRYYETKEIRDSEGHLILPKGKRVNADFSVKYYDNVLSTYQTKSGTNVVTGISNYVHETRLNDDKRFIFVLKEEFLQEFINDFRDIMIYGKSSQFIDDKTIQTENLNISMP
ncbi:MAG: hypothetical protein CMN34_07220 [Saprospirales bacterium]|nr:hypothetical protein [Saprospirales bacterium]|tara:strand:- start:5657 stop:6322 length:666 start_codon:yes stop_codon:yes gene_type:complete